jgi:hypothetical protein
MTFLEVALKRNLRGINIMQLRKLSIFSMVILFVILCMTIPWGGVPRVLFASPLLPYVSPEMENPEFWIKKIENPGRLLLTTEEIQKMNEETLQKEGLYLCRVKDLKEEWTREEILSLMNEDWEGFGRTEEIRYGKYGYPLGDSFWNGLKENMNQPSLKDVNRVDFGLIVKRTDIRVFPTEECSKGTPDSDEFDRFQHSTIAPGSLVGIYYFSQDKVWAYVQTGFIRGWVRMADLATAKDRMEAIRYEEEKDRLVITGSFVKVFSDPLCREMAFEAQMGTSFPILSQTTSPGPADNMYVIRIPFREVDGGLSFRNAYIRKDGDVHLGFLPYTQENLARQAFKMIHQPYGWGEMFGARDCSRFIMDIFATFGIIMPRNSKFQARIGIGLGQLDGKSLKEKERVLDRAIPLATTLRMPGHIMLYLGKENGRHYAIHNVWGVQRRGWFGPVMDKIKKTVVSDLSLGRSGPLQSLLHRITDIQTVASESEVFKKLP